MHPTLFFPLIHTYGLMLAVGFYAAWWLGARQGKAEGLDTDLVGNLVLIAIIAGIVGARLLYVVLNFDPREPLWTVIKVWEGGLVFYGGLIAAAVAVVIYLKWRRVPLWRVADVTAPAIAIGQAFGRIGCFLNGCCFGGPATAGFPLAVRFPGEIGPDGKPLGSPAFGDQFYRKWLDGDWTASLSVHPTQLYDAVFLFLIAGILVAAMPRRRRYGEVFGLMAILNAASRLGTELVRRDEGAALLGLTAGQIGAIVVLLAGLAIFLWARTRGEPVAGIPAMDEKCA